MFISEDVLEFLKAQGFTIVSTIDKNGRVHNACKGIVEIMPDGKIYLLDLYHGETFRNLERNPQITLSAVDEHRFKGYSLKGRAKIVQRKELSPQVIADWEAKLTSRITQRVIKNIQGQKGHREHPEALLPKPKYLIEMQVEEVVDLTPAHIKEKK